MTVQEPVSCECDCKAFRRISLPLCTNCEHWDGSRLDEARKAYKKKFGIPR
jgi:hypothetical protein